MSDRSKHNLYLACFPAIQQDCWSKIMTKVKPKFTAEADALASIPIDLQTAHFFNPTTEDRI